MQAHRPRVSLLLALVAATLAARVEPWQAGSDERPVFDAVADPAAALGRTILHARAENRRVLVVWGVERADDRALCELLRTGRTDAWPFYYEFLLLPVAAGPGARHGLDLAARLGADLSRLPAVSVLDAEGTPLAHHAAEEWRTGAGWDAAAIGRFLLPLAAPPLDAEAIVRDGLARAAAEKKRLFLRFGTPWCGWCDRLEEFLGHPRVAPLLARDYVQAEVDVERTTHGAEVLRRYAGSVARGYPWFAILDADGEVLGDSDAPTGNVGCPVQPEETAWFVDLLRRTRIHLSDTELAVVADELERFASPLRDG